MHIIPHNLLSNERMWAHSCCLTPPHRSRTGTTWGGAWRMLWCVRERSRLSSPSQLWVTGPLSPYNVNIYLFCIELLLYSKMWHSILCHDSSYVWNLVPTHLVMMFAPGSWCPETRVWHDCSSMVRDRCTRGSIQFSTGSGRLERCNTLLPGVDLLCGGLQEDSLVWRMLENWVDG
jgi:hypothetical protein